MSVPLLTGAVMLFCGIVLSLSIIGVITQERRIVAKNVAAIKAYNDAPIQMKKELDKPFSERVLGPMGDRLVGIGRRITRADTAERIRHKLDIAGNPPGWDVNRIIGLKVLGLVILGGVALLYVFGNEMPLSKAALITGVGGAGGYLLPNLLLHNAGEKREKLMLNALPDALDLMTISVEAGLGFDAAVSRVAKETTGPLAEEFSRMMQEMQIGVGRMDAMRAMGERSAIKDLKSFALAMVQADSFGIPIARVLRIQSTEMRQKRRQRAEEKAQAVPVKILFPLVFCILPCLFIIILGPVVIKMLGFFGG